MRKKVFCRIPIFLICVFSASIAFAQQKTITGVVSDQNGNPLPKATVNVKGEKVFTTTDANGFFRIGAPQDAKTLVVTYVGREPMEVSIEGKTNVLVSLNVTQSKMDEVVVIGYGTIKRANINSAVSSISEKDIKNLPVAGVDQALQGKVAGVTVNSNTGQPGGGISVRVRGITTPTGSNEPLYVIDGVPIYTNSSSTPQDQLGGVPGQSSQSVMATLNPNDIASIDILKDASAQAIYGAQGAAGVVLITTKHGRNGEGKLSYDVYYGWQNVQKKLPVMNLRQYAEYYNSVVGEGTVSGLDTIGEFKNPALLGKGTDWQDAIFQTGPIQNHQLSFSGGNGKTTYYFSGNYFSQDGTVIGSNFKRYAARMSIDQQVKTWLKAGISANLSKTNQRITVTDGQQSVISLVLYNSPATPVKAFDGTFVDQIPIAGVPFGNTQNPVALASLRDVTSDQSKAFGNIYADLQFTKDLSFRTQLNYDFQLTQNSAFQPNILYPTGVLAIGPSRMREDRNNSYYWEIQNYLTYSHAFGKHYVNAVAGHVASNSLYNAEYVSAYNLILNQKSISAGTIDPSQTGGANYPGSGESYFGRVNYVYNDKYSISGTVRRDGSSGFGPGNRFGTFPAVSVGWTVSNEDFAKKWSFVDYLKVRAGYGQVGSSSGAGSNVYNTNIRLVPSINGLFGQTDVAGVPANVGNPFLQWQAIATYNAGFDAGFLNRKIEVALDVYKKITTKMILPTVLPIFAGLDANPPNNSYQDIEPPTTNAGQMTNTGIDIAVTSHNINNANGFTWSTTAIFSSYHNNFDKSYSAGAQPIFGRSAQFSPVTLTETTKGQPVGSFYGFVTDGLYRSMADLNSGPAPILPVGQTGTWLGDVRYKDLNGDKKITSADETFIGSPHPKFTYGLTNNFSYKGFDLSIFLQGVYGDKILNFSRRETEALFSVYANQLVTVMDRYTATNTNGKLPRYNQWNNDNWNPASDRFIEDGSYLRIQNVSLGYNLPKNIISKAKMTLARVYISAQNLHTFTKYSGFDPELGSFNGNVTQMNIDYGHYPNPRTFTIGANLEF